MNIYSICTKGLGALSAGLVAYDAHKHGVTMGTMHSKSNLAANMTDEYINAHSISKVSSVELNAKKSWFRFVMDNNIKESIDTALGYVKGCWESFVSELVPATLATGALLSKKNSVFGKVCGLGLVIYGAKYLVYDVIGFGKRKYLGG